MEFIVQEASTQKIYDISELVTNICYKSEMQNGAGKLTFDYMKQGIMFTPGSIVRFKYRGYPIFYGYIFDTSNKAGELLEVIAYDQLRYFKNKDTMIMKGFTASKLIGYICDKYRLRKGTIEDTVHLIPNTIIRKKTLLDMSYNALDNTLLATKEKFILLDDFGSIALRNAISMRLPIMIGDESFAYGYTYNRSIDNNTYNRIKLAKPNGDTLNYYIQEDTSTQARWGILQYYEELDKNADENFIKKKASDLLKLYNREETKLSIPALGDPRVRGGSGIRIKLANLMIDQWFLVKSVTHEFKKDIHTMDLELMT